MSEGRRYVPPPVGRSGTSQTGPVRHAVGDPVSVQNSIAAPSATSVPQGHAQAAGTEDMSQATPSRRRRRGGASGKGRGLWRKLFFAAWAGLTILIAVGAIGLWRQAKQSTLAVDTGKYQAVFLTSGQVYFGKLHAYNSESIKLTDVYYLQTQAGEEAGSENPQQAAADGPNVQLVKLGNEIHGPQDEMVVYKNQVLFYENLKPESQVAQSIEKHKTSK